MIRPWRRSSPHSSSSERAFTGPVGVAWCIGAGALQGLIVAVPMLLSGRKIANTELHDVHGDDPELGARPRDDTDPNDDEPDEDASAADADADERLDERPDERLDERPDERLMGRHVPFGPFLGLAALEYILMKDAIDAAIQRLVSP